jgi:predicted ribosomally synthesized peptide with SipW-like signal peptide
MTGCGTIARKNKKRASMRLPKLKNWYEFCEGNPRFTAAMSFGTAAAITVAPFQSKLLTLICVGGSVALGTSAAFSAIDESMQNAARNSAERIPTRTEPTPLASQPVKPGQT